MNILDQLYDRCFNIVEASLQACPHYVETSLQVQKVQLIVKAVWLVTQRSNELL